TRPRWLKELEGVDAVTLSQGWVGSLSVWVIDRRDASPDYFRRVRLHIAKLHAESEVLRIVLRSLGGNISVRGKSVDPDALQEYLNNSIRLVSKSRREGIEQALLLEKTMR